MTDYKRKEWWDITIKTYRRHFAGDPVFTVETITTSNLPYWLGREKEQKAKGNWEILHYKPTR